MKKSKHGHRMSSGKNKSIRGEHHQAYDSPYGDHKASGGGKRAVGDKAAREKRLSKERM